MHKNKSFVQSISNATSGLRTLLKEERNARFHLLATVCVILVSIVFQINRLEWLFILSAIFLVWIAEAFNTSLEKLFDLVEPCKNKYVMAGKDLSAGGVLLSALLSVIIGAIILGPPIVKTIVSLLQNHK